MISASHNPYEDNGVKIFKKMVKNLVRRGIISRRKNSYKTKYKN